MQGVGLQLPADTSAFGSVGIITYRDGKVKIESVPYGQYIHNSGNNADAKFSLSDSQGRHLTDDQAACFEKFKARDKDGKLKMVYHGSGADFTEFSYKYMGEQGSSKGCGICFTDNRNMAEDYQKRGTKLMEGCLDIQKPLSDSEVTLKRSELVKLLKAVDPTGDDVVIYTGIGYPLRAWYNRALNAAVESIFTGSESDSEILAEIANAGGGNETVLKNAQELFGYDGYIVEGKYEDATVYVAFESNRFKNADNLHPTKEQDVCYSLSQEGSRERGGRFNGEDLRWRGEPADGAQDASGSACGNPSG